MGTKRKSRWPTTHMDATIDKDENVPTWSQYLQPDYGLNLGEKSRFNWLRRNQMKKKRKLHCTREKPRKTRRLQVVEEGGENVSKKKKMKNEKKRQSAHYTKPGGYTNPRNAKGWQKRIEKKTHWPSDDPKS